MIDPSQLLFSQVSKHGLVVNIVMKKTFVNVRVRTGHGKPGRSWNLLFQFPVLESHGILVKVMEKQYAFGK